jgi:uncharacterized protein
MRLRFRFLILAAALLAVAGLPAAERIPPAPPRYFNDNAGVVSRPVADQLNARLEQFERESSNQLLVAIYPKMESDSSVEDYTVRVASAWKAGQAGRNNGAVLFVFMAEHTLYLQVGYGLESVLPDATAKRIIEREIVPRFRARDVDGGMTAAVNAMIAATQGEYEGTGQTRAESRRSPVLGSSTARGALIFLALIVFVPLIFFLIVRQILSRSTVIRNPRRVGTFDPPVWSSSGSSGSSWGGSSSSGGGFSGGGGSFGGGGAGGKW